MNLLTQNSKLKKTSDVNNAVVYNFGIPAQDTCLWAGDCKKVCYASKGFYRFANTAKAFKDRLAVTKQDNFPDLLFEEIILKKATHIRIHDSGDFYSREYLHKWLKVIEALPHVQFYAYSKSLPLFEGEKLPDNFILIKSEGGKRDDLIGKDDRHARIFTSLDELIKSGY